jgi:hypothetical protein
MFLLNDEPSFHQNDGKGSIEKYFYIWQGFTEREFKKFPKNLMLDEEEVFVIKFFPEMYLSSRYPSTSWANRKKFQIFGHRVKKKNDWDEVVQKWALGEFTP